MKRSQINPTDIQGRISYKNKIDKWKRMQENQIGDEVAEQKWIRGMKMWEIVKWERALNNE